MTNEWLPPDYAARLPEPTVPDEVRFSRWAAPPARPTLCECDRFKHEREPCTFPPQDNGPVVSSPALCTACLFYCWADE